MPGESMYSLDLVESYKIVPCEFGLYKYVTPKGDAIVPLPSGGWKVVYSNGSEVELPTNDKWILLFDNEDIITTLPYKSANNNRPGWIIIPRKARRFFYYRYVTYPPGSIYSLGGLLYEPWLHEIDIDKLDMTDKQLRKLEKRKRREEKLSRKRDKRDDDDEDDEDNIMRALGSGNGDKFGF